MQGMSAAHQGLEWLDGERSAGKGLRHGAWGMKHRVQSIHSMALEGMEE